MTDPYPKFSKREGPDLQKLVAAFGGYDKITPEAWTRFEKQRQWWLDYVRSGDRALEDIQREKSRSADQRSETRSGNAASGVRQYGQARQSRPADR